VGSEAGAAFGAALAFGAADFAEADAGVAPVPGPVAEEPGGVASDAAVVAFPGSVAALGAGASAGVAAPGAGGVVFASFGGSAGGVAGGGASAGLDGSTAATVSVFSPESRR